MINSAPERIYTPPVHKLSWAAIFAGLVIALSVQIVLSLLGIGIGASTVHPTSAQGASAQSVGTGGAVWFVITSLIALFAGGWIAGRVAGVPHRAYGVVHGLVAWGLTSLVTIYVLTTAVGGVVSGATGVIGAVFSAAGSTVAAAAPGLTQAATSEVKSTGVTPDALTSKIQQLLSETDNPKLAPSKLRRLGKHEAHESKGAALNPTDSKVDANELVYKFLHDTDTDSKATDRRDLINVVAAEQHVSKAQAAKTVDGWTQEAEQAKAQAEAAQKQAVQKAKEAGDATADAVSKGALSAFFLFLLGAIAAALGGALSIRSVVRDHTYVTQIIEPTP